VLGGSESLRLLKVINGLYQPTSRDEARRLAERARLNKLYLAYLRRVGGVLGDELELEESRFKRFTQNTLEVVKALEGVDYALYKFRRPVDHVSVDLDILVNTRDIPRAVKSLQERGFRVIVPEPYTITMERRGFIADLYTMPSFTWVVYMDGLRLIEEHSSDIELWGTTVRALSREAEVAVAAAHAVYKEHLVLLMDCLVAWRWLSSGAWRVAAELGVEDALRELLKACDLVKRGLAEAPYRLGPHTLARAYLGKALGDPVFRATLPNALRYLLSHKDTGAEVLGRLTRRSY